MKKSSHRVSCWRSLRTCRALGRPEDRTNLAGACRICNHRRALAITKIPSDVLLPQFVHLRDVLNYHRRVDATLQIPTEPMAMEHLETRPWVTGPAKLPAARPAVRVESCSRCQTKLRLTAKKRVDTILTEAVVGGRSNAPERTRRLARQR